MKYPDYVKEYRPKGTVVKKVGKTYYAYYATSRREPGKKYPVQVIRGLAGRIDENGFHEQTRMVLETKHVKVRECGFTNYLMLFEEEYVTHFGRSRMDGKAYPLKTRRNIYRSMIVYLSGDSYLTEEKGTTIYTPEELSEKYGIGIPRQLTAISRMIELPLSELEPLKYICMVEIDGKKFESELTKGQEEAIRRLGIREEDIRRRNK